MANEVEIIVRSSDRSAPGIDSALRRIEKLKTEARDVRDVKVDVKVDSADAAAKIRRVKAQEDTVRDIHVKVDVDQAKAGAEIDRLKRKLQELREKSLSPLLTTALGLGPALLPVLAQGVTIAGSLTNSLAGAGAAAGVFGAVVKSTFGDVKEASTKTDGLREKIRLLNREIQLAPAGSKLQAQAMKEQAKATLELNARLSLLPPTTRAAVVAFGSMKSAWEDFKDKNKGETFGFLTRAFNLAKAVIPKLQPLFDAGAKAANSLMSVFERKLKDGGIQRFIEYLAQHAGKALADSVTIFTNLGRTIANFVKATDDGGGALQWITDLTTKIAAFSKGKAFTDFLAWVHSNGAKVGDTLATIAKAAVQIAKAVTPLAPVSLAVAKALAAIIAATPPGVITAIVAGLVAYSVAVKAIGVAQKVWAVGSAIVTAAQWALNFALDANPIGLVIVGIAALVAAFVLAYKHSATFRLAVNALWSVFKSFIGWLVVHVGSAIAFVIDRFGDMATFVGNVLSHIPGMGAAGKALKDLGASAHAAAQKVRDVADAIAGVHSKNVSLRVTYETVGGYNAGVATTYQRVAGAMHAQAAGGITPGRAAGGGPRSNRTLVGEYGPELVDLAPGSQVHSNPDSQRLMGAESTGQRVVIEIHSGGSALDDVLVEVLRKAIRTRGGNVQLALGR